VSAAVHGDVFSTCWGIGSLTPCTTGSPSPPPPVTTASLSANPRSVSPGQPSDLSWNSTNASSCTGGGFTASAISGSVLVYPSVTTAYSVTCSGIDGSATAMATVTVNAPRTCRGKHCN